MPNGHGTASGARSLHAHLACTPLRRGSGRLVERVAADGSLAGYELELGRARRGPQRVVELPAESFLGDRVGDAVLVGSDDGLRSRLRLVGAGHGCERVIATSRERIFRRAAIDPAGQSVVALHLERRTRRELGIFRRPLGGGRWERLLGPLADDAPAVLARIGPIFATILAWSGDGATLAVQSCGSHACATRVVAGDGGSKLLLGRPGQGPLLRVERDLLLTLAVCAGTPCPIVRTRLSTGEVLP
jgi:hypothetical protein